MGRSSNRKWKKRAAKYLYAPNVAQALDVYRIFGKESKFNRWLSRLSNWID